MSRAGTALQPAGPGLVVASPRSGSGKTTLTLGLLAALVRRGVRVAAAKAGPDYIDPAFHALATGRPSVNLDGWTMRPALLDGLAAAQGAGADLVVCEGLMGLHDGVAARGATGDGSTADLAARFGWPVVLVVDATGQSQSAGAVALGFARFRPEVPFAGVILNRLASPRHEALARRGVEAAGLTVLGAVGRREAIVLPERHLGLVQAGEIDDLAARFSALADLVEETCDVDAVLAAAGAGAAVAVRSAGNTAVAENTAVIPDGAVGDDPGSEDRQALAQRPIPDLRSAPSGMTGGVTARTGRPAGARTTAEAPTETLLTAVPSPLVAVPPPGQRVALARDVAFSFAYPHLLAGWRAAGAEILPFSPLADEAPPQDADCCWLPGGYPELHAGRLAANRRFLDGLARFAATRPVHGECGGHMVLGRALIDADGTAHAMAGLLGHTTSFARRKLNLGYRTATLLADGPLGPAGTAFRGHEFHYATVVEHGADTPLFAVTDANGAPVEEAGSRRGLVSGSFFHLIDAG